MELQGRTAVVTGGAVRIGRAISLALARQGAHVFIHYNRSIGPAEALRDEILATGGVAAIGSGDLSDPGQAHGLMHLAQDTLGPMAVLVNSASAFPTDTLEEITLDGWRS
ncbi:hypothetical protein MNBD_ACTINO01-2577, partial [hydrothermal vent metagenome]